MPLQPVTPRVLTVRLVELVASLDAGRRWRLGIDGAPSTRPGDLAAALVDPLRAVGRPVVRISAGDFLRPASLRWERGRQDPGAFYDDWLDRGALSREVLAAFGPGGSGRYLPSLRDPVRDRPTRAPLRQAPEGAILLLDGGLLLGRGLALDRTVHLAVRPATLERTTPEHERWTLPAYARYAREVEPERWADVVVRVDDPRHPALLGGLATDSHRRDPR